MAKKKLSNNLVIISIALIGAGGGIVAAIVTGCFGLLKKTPQTNSQSVSNSSNVVQVNSSTAPVQVNSPGSTQINSSGSPLINNSPGAVQFNNSTGQVNIFQSGKQNQTIDEDGNPIGYLLPANDPMPNENWAPPNSSFLIFGGNTCAVYPKIIVPAVQFLGTNILEIGIINGMAFVSGQFFDKDGKLVAILETNRWTLNRNNYFRKFPTSHSLIVMDNHNTELLDVNYCNSRVFQISGVIRFPDSSVATITTNKFVFTGDSFKDMIYAGNKSFSAGGFGIQKPGRYVGIGWGIPIQKAQ